MSEDDFFVIIGRLYVQVWNSTKTIREQSYKLAASEEALQNALAPKNADMDAVPDDSAGAD